MNDDFGMGEWAEKSINILNGCPHACRYCYGAAGKRLHKQHDAGTNPELYPTAVARKAERVGGWVAFPSTHDITPDFLEPCLTELHKQLAAGNKVLVVTKPHLKCIERVCADFTQYKSSILFRFTIGAFDNEILKFWEPGAPDYEERLACLEYARKADYQTSVSMEPMLDTPNAAELFRQLEPLVSDTIWLGKMNKPRERIANWEAIDDKIKQIEADQAPDKLLALYNVLKNKPKARFKAEFRQAIGLVDLRMVPIADIIILDHREAAEVAGMANMIEDVGLLNPVTVRPGNILVAGRRRLEACQKLGWTEIPVHTIGVSDLQAEMATIEENLGLPVSDEALRRLKVLYEDLYPETKAGGDRHKKPKCTFDSFRVFAAKKLGVSQSTIGRRCRQKPVPETQWAQRVERAVKGIKRLVANINPALIPQCDELVAALRATPTPEPAADSNSNFRILAD
jgi:hypothetical protein